MRALNFLNSGVFLNSFMSASYFTASSLCFASYFSFCSAESASYLALMTADRSFMPAGLPCAFSSSMTVVVTSCEYRKYALPGFVGWPLALSAFFGSNSCCAAVNFFPASVSFHAARSFRYCSFCAATFFSSASLSACGSASHLCLTMPARAFMSPAGTFFFCISSMTSFMIEALNCMYPDAGAFGIPDSCASFFAAAPFFFFLCAPSALRYSLYSADFFHSSSFAS
mmetsp:Transcript_4818/g.11860  ORF Transcript_4818/g.11860 Transcript_4818/m.11860 type:complete len:227 (-) Transcript_4818:505-1185(-)